MSPNGFLFSTEYADTKLLIAGCANSCKPEQNRAMPPSIPVPKSDSSRAILILVMTGCNSDSTSIFSVLLVAFSSLVNIFFRVAVGNKKIFIRQGYADGS